MSSHAAAVGEWLGISLDTQQWSALHRYEQWLSEEAETAGGIGPGEARRLYDRHILDSLAFATAIPQAVTTLADVGSGVGLPGIPLAILWPERLVTLIDRSQRRAVLARRAVRILGLDNVTVSATDVNQVRDSFDAVLFRASLPLEAATTAFSRLTHEEGIGVLGITRSHERPKIAPSPSGIGYELLCEHPEVLDTPAWLLRMTHT